MQQPDHLKRAHVKPSCIGLQPNFGTDAANAPLLNLLNTVGHYYFIKEEPFKLRAYNTVLRNIGLYDYEIISGEQAETEIRGVGIGIKEDIDEFLNSVDAITGKGRSTRLERLEKEFPEISKVLNYMESFYGIDSWEAQQLYAYGARTADDIYSERHLLTESAREALPWYEHLEKTLHPKEYLSITEYIKQNLNMQHLAEGARPNGKPGWFIAMGNPGAKGVKVAIVNGGSRKQYKNIFAPIVKEFLNEDARKITAIYQLSDRHVAHRIDFVFIDEKELPFVQLDFASPPKFVEAMRKRANDRGYNLSTYHLCGARTDKKSITTEREIFGVLRVKYVSPKNRKSRVTPLK